MLVGDSFLTAESAAYKIVGVSVFTESEDPPAAAQIVLLQRDLAEAHAALQAQQERLTELEALQVMVYTSCINQPLKSDISQLAVSALSMFGCTLAWCCIV